MATTRRTTVTAASDDLSALSGEAKRRGVSLSKVLSEAVSDKAAEVRKRTRPRGALFAAGGQGISERMDQDPQGPAKTPFRS
ncbi:MAG: hypothetical protein ACR2FO_08785 [Actinomycetota bacterium]